MSAIEKDIVITSEKIISHGLLHSLASKLAKTPRSEWHNIANDKNYENISLISISELDINKLLLNRLNSGEVIVKTGKTYQFINDVIARKTAYKKIINTSYCLAYSYSDPQRTISYLLKPSLENITRQLLSTDQENRTDLLKHLERIYGYPIQLYMGKRGKLPYHVTAMLIHNDIAFETNNNTSKIATIYYQFKEGILKIGPLSYLSITARISDVIEYFIIAFFIFCLLSLIVLSVLFIRNLIKIYHITDQYSKGNFGYQNKVRISSTLYGLYLNIIHMGNQLKNLIESNKMICRYIPNVTGNANAGLIHCLLVKRKRPRHSVNYDSIVFSPQSRNGVAQLC